MKADVTVFIASQATDGGPFKAGQNGNQPQSMATAPEGEWLLSHFSACAKIPAMMTDNNLHKSC